MKYILTPILILLASSALALPQTTSKLDGYDGLKIENLNSEQCSLVFPEGYGLNEDQLKKLISMSDGAIEHDLGCMAPAAFHSLDQIVILATELQSSDAADLIFMKKFTNLGVSISEEFTAEYQISVLRKYKKAKEYFELNTKLAGKIPKLLVNTLCNEWAYDFEQVKTLIQDLDPNDLGDIAISFKKGCDAEIQKIPYLNNRHNKPM